MIFFASADWLHESAVWEVPSWNSTFLKGVSHFLYNKRMGKG